MGRRLGPGLPNRAGGQGGAMTVRRTPPADEDRCVCDGEVRCTSAWTHEADLLCDACRADRERRA